MRNHWKILWFYISPFIIFNDTNLIYNYTYRLHCKWTDVIRACFVKLKSFRVSYISVYKWGKTSSKKHELYKATIPRDNIFAFCVYLWTSASFQSALSFYRKPIVPRSSFSLLRLQCAIYILHAFNSWRKVAGGFILFALFFLFSLVLLFSVINLTNRWVLVVVNLCFFKKGEVL